MSSGKDQILGRTVDTILDNRVKVTTGDNAPVDDTNPLSVREWSKVDTNNSTNVNLIADAVYTGTPTEVTQYGSIAIAVYSDTGSATDGLQIEQSVDGTDWHWLDNYTIPAGVGKTYQVQPAADYLRIVYTNSDTSSSDFHIRTILHPDYIKPSSHRIGETISAEDDAELVMNVNKAQIPSGTFVNIGATASSNLRVANVEDGLSIAKGDVVGTSNTNKFGNAPDFDTGDGEVDIWDGADDGNEAIMNYTFSTTADIDRLSSSSASDTVDIEVQGLDTDYNLVNQTITLTGQTPVALTTSLIRIFRMKNVGSTNIVGRVYCFVNGATTGGVPDTLTDIRAIIDNGNNQTEMAIYTVPAGKTGYIREIYASTAGGSRASNYGIKLKIRPFGQVFQLKHRRAINDDKDMEKIFDTPEVAQEKSDIIMTAETFATSITGSSVSAGFDIILVDN